MGEPNFSQALAGTSATPPWTVDPTLAFDRLHIIESLPERGRSMRTGQRLFEELESSS
jgi:hypothetical protein